MKLPEYSDGELLEEVKHRGFHIELGEDDDGKFVLIGGVTFDITEEKPKHQDYPKYARCKIKNIAILNKVKARFNLKSYIELVNTLPNDCIRLHSVMGWCYSSHGSVCRECENEQ